MNYVLRRIWADYDQSIQPESVSLGELGEVPPTGLLQVLNVWCLRLLTGRFELQFKPVEWDTQPAGSCWQASAFRAEMEPISSRNQLENAPRFVVFQ
jgi:hypothetical protein